MQNIKSLKPSRLNLTGLAFCFAAFGLIIFFSLILMRYDARLALPSQIKAISENINQSLSYKLENESLKETLTFGTDIKKENPAIDESSIEFANIYSTKITAWQKNNVDHVIGLVEEALNKNSSDLTYYDYFYLPLILNNFYMFSSNFDNYKPLNDMRENLKAKLSDDSYESIAAKNAQSNLDLICGVSSLQSAVCKIKNNKMNSTYSYLTGSAINYHAIASAKLMDQGFKELEKSPSEIRENYAKILEKKKKLSSPLPDVSSNASNSTGK